MKSRIPKVLHPLCGLHMLDHVLNAVRDSGIRRTVLVTPPSPRSIQRHANGAIQSAVQPQPLGTGHAVLCAMPLLEQGSTANGGARSSAAAPEHLLVLAGDVPLLRPQTLQALMQRHLDGQSDVTVLTAVGLPPHGLGRVVRDGSGAIARIVEELHAEFGQHHISEVNSGIYCFRASALWPRLSELTPSPSGELYLTDVIDLTVRSSGKVAAYTAEDPWDVFGVNTRQQLVKAAAVMRRRLCDQWLDHGVTIVDPDTTYLDATVALGQDTVVQPNTHLYGKTTVGRDCTLGPGAVIVDTAIGDRCHVQGSVLEGAVLERRVTIGPFCHLRPGAHLKSGVHLGNFVEVKNSTIGEGTASGHFSYLGDATIGKNVNIGAGSITCNYDGKRKNRTTIGDNAFIGCDTMLVAPIAIGARSVTGAGSVVTHNVPDDTLVVGTPARPRPRADA